MFELNKPLLIVLFAILCIYLVPSCGRSNKIHPFDSNTLNRMTFNFFDLDSDKDEVGGDLTFDISPRLIPHNIDFVVYWSDKPNQFGKTEYLGQISANKFRSESAPIVVIVPENTKIKERFFVLYLRAQNGQEVFSGKASLVADLH